MDSERKSGVLWALIQQWLDSMPYPPSQRRLASRLAISPSALSDWKYGEGFPSPEHLYRLATEIQVPYEKVLDAVLQDRGYRGEKLEEIRRGPTTAEERAEAFFRSQRGSKPPHEKDVRERRKA